jgi:hypothetical protein
MQRLDAFHNKVRVCPCMERVFNDGIPVRHQLLAAFRCAKRRYEFLGAFAKLRKAAVSFVSTACLSAHAHSTTELPPDGLPWNFIIEDFFENPFRKFKFGWSLTKITGTLRENSCTFMIPPQFLIIRNVSDESCRENQNIFYIQYFFPHKSYHLWDNVEKYGTARRVSCYNIIRCMRFACRLRKAIIQTQSYNM